LGGLYWSIGWLPSLELLSLIALLTTAEALVMVSGAVVISSQTTSVRAANILASFVIIPMALLVQAESIIMFWANYEPLWWIVAALIAADVLLVRMGIHLFNREELLGREIDALNLGQAWRYFARFFRHRTLDVQRVLTKRRWFSLPSIYTDIGNILRSSWQPICVVIVTQLIAFIAGWAYAEVYSFPSGVLALDVPEDAFENIPDVGFLPEFSVGAILFHNLRVLILGGILGLFSFGTMPIVLLMVPMAIIGYFAGQAPAMGTSPWMLLGTFILPHGVVELPAAIIATGLALRLGAVVISPPKGMTVSQGVLSALADLTKSMVFLIVPLLAIAALLEVWLTPWIIVQVW
jgi:uncharacterized membrane protein SpoIIM required for sporulation